MNDKIRQLREHSLLTCALTEEIIGRLRVQHKQEWLATRTRPINNSAEAHDKATSSGIAVATVGLIGATGVAIAGGPVVLGFAAFAVGSAAAGKAIYHAVACKFHELRQESNALHAYAYEAPTDEDLALIAQRRGPALWDEAVSNLLTRGNGVDITEPINTRRLRPGR